MINQELLEAAQALGAALRQAGTVQDYLAACADCAADADLVTQEERLLAVYQALAARQRAGEQLAEEEVQEYYALRAQVQASPQVMTRETALAGVKRLFVDAGAVLSNQLGLDFTELALASPED
jgi:cell fate (sporulation/competence/biofilm development) regulator YlbF (YheA/YmcA/DUF963 family)